MRGGVEAGSEAAVGGNVQASGCGSRVDFRVCGRCEVYHAMGNRFRGPQIVSCCLARSPEYLCYRGPLLASV